MIGRRSLRFGAPPEGGPPALELTLFSPEWDAAQCAVGIGYEVHGCDGMAWLDLGPWKLNASWLASIPEPWRLAWRALRQRCSVEGDWLLRRRQRAWYTAKVLACLALGRDEEHAAPTSEPVYVGDDTIDIAYLDGGSYAPTGEPTTYWADVLRVGRGVRRGWWYEVGYVST